MTDNILQKSLSAKLKAINQFLMDLYRLGASTASFLFSLQTGARVVPCNRVVATSPNARALPLLLPLSGGQEYSYVFLAQPQWRGALREEQLPT